MNNKKELYSIVSIILFLLTITILAVVDKSNNVKLSLIIQIIMMVYILKISWGCVLYIKKQYRMHKYSYAIVMNVGVLIFLIINFFRHLNLLISGIGKSSINDIYSLTLDSFSSFAMVVLPLIIIIAIYSVFTNIFLIRKEGVKFHNLIGIMFGVCILLTTAGSQYLYIVIKNIEIVQSHIYIKRFVDIGINSVLCYFYCLTLATLYCNIMASIHIPKFDKDYMIILGSKIRSDGTLTPILRGRVDRAIEFSKMQKEANNKEITFIPSGGKGKDELFTEAEAMKNYLTEQGISENKIIIENKSKNTIKNISNSKKLIDKNKGGNIAFATTNYHVFRSGVIANNQGIDCEGIGSKTKWYFYANAMLREFIANLVMQKKEHLALISFINISLFVLIIIGYHYNLLQY